MDLTEFLSAAEARCERASEGPWHAKRDSVVGIMQSFYIAQMQRAGELHCLRDAEFIAAARSDLPRALALLRKALEVVEAVRVYTTLRNYLTVEACRMDQDRLEKLVIEKLIRFDAAVKDEGGS